MAAADDLLVAVTPAPVLTDAEKAQVTALHDQLAPDARVAFVSYFLCRTPAHLVEEMKTKVTVPA